MNQDQGPTGETGELGFPVSARTTTACTARGRVFEVGFNVTVTIGDATVNAGDLALADGTAMVLVQREAYGYHKLQSME